MAMSKGRRWELRCAIPAKEAQWGDTLLGQAKVVDCRSEKDESVPRWDRRSGSGSGEKVEESVWQAAGQQQQTAVR